MKTSLLCAAVTCLTASLAFAQTEETTEQVQMQVELPGMPAGVNMKVKTRTTTTTTTSTTARMGEPQPVPQRQPQPVYGADDCGAGAGDLGCSTWRAGNAPMDREEFSGFLEALRSNDFELERADIVKDTLKRSWLTARQLGLVLDLFENELTRLDVAKRGVARLVNPKHALKLSSKFENSLNASDFTKAVNAQR